MDNITRRVYEAQLSRIRWLKRNKTKFPQTQRLVVLISHWDKELNATAFNNAIKTAVAMRFNDNRTMSNRILND